MHSTEGSPGERAGAGPAPVAQRGRAVSYDLELAAFDQPLLRAAAVRPGETVLDIGCGSGRSTREVARAARPGRVIGVDISAPEIERARRRAAAERVDNVAYCRCDAQTHPFAEGVFDVAVSRFGVMFFDDPLAAFTNVARGLRPDGRLAILVWQARHLNPWVSAVDDALGRRPHHAVPAAIDAFSLHDPDATTLLLRRAGFVDVHLDDLDEPVCYGHDVATALEWVTGWQTVRDDLAAMTKAGAADAVERLRATLEAHRTDRDGVVLGSRAWMITAVRGPVRRGGAR